MFERFLKVHAVFTYLPKFGFHTSKGSLIFRTGKVAIFTAAITEQCSSKPDRRRRGYNLEEVTSDSQLTEGTWLISHTKPLYPSMLL